MVVKWEFKKIANWKVVEFLWKLWKYSDHNDIDCVSDLDLLRKAIISESLLTTFKASIIFWGSWGSGKTWLSLKPNHHNQV